MPESEGQFQLWFDFDKPDSQPSTPYNIPPEAAPEVENTEERISRITRRVREEVFLRSPLDAAQYLSTKIYVPFEEFDQEELWVLMLNTKNRITHEAMVYRGTINTIYIRQAELFKEVIRVNAAALCLSHCHPSGDPTPSPEDIAVTKEAYAVAKMLGIELVDHIVIGDNCWISLRDKGWGFEGR